MPLYSVPSSLLFNPNDTFAVSKVRILENRLDKALTKFNEALAHNKSLRQEVMTRMVAASSVRGYGSYLHVLQTLPFGLVPSFSLQVIHKGRGGGDPEEANLRLN